MGVHRYNHNLETARSYFSQVVTTHSYEERLALAALSPDEVPLNLLNPRPGTPFGGLEPMSAIDALRAVATFRLVMPRTILRFAGDREVTLGDLAERGARGGVDALSVGNYLTTLVSPATQDLAMLAGPQMPIRALARTL